MSLCLLEIPGRKAPSRAVALLVLGQSLRVGKSGVREGASARWCGGRARGRRRRLESRNDRMQEGGEGGINPRTSSERLLCATHGLGTGDSARNMENPAVPLQDAV